MINICPKYFMIIVVYYKEFDGLMVLIIIASIVCEYVFHISAVVTVSVEVLDNTILEGDSTFLTVTYTGTLHPQSAVHVIITSTPGSASG